VSPSACILRGVLRSGAAVKIAPARLIEIYGGLRRRLRGLWIGRTALRLHRHEFALSNTRQARHRCHRDTARCRLWL